MRPLSYLPQPVGITTIGNTSYLFEANNYNLPIYFALKGRHDYDLVNSGDFISQISNVVETLIEQYDMIMIPESRYNVLKRVISRFPNVIELSKRSKLEICNRVLQTPSWRKIDVQSATKAWNDMGDTFTINTIKANKRKDYVPHLFEPYEVPPDSKVLLLDDFIMSGNTIDAMAAAIGRTNYHALGLFYQK